MKKLCNQRKSILSLFKKATSAVLVVTLFVSNAHTSDSPSSSPLTTTPEKKKPVSKINAIGLVYSSMNTLLFIADSCLTVYSIVKPDTATIPMGNMSSAPMPLADTGNATTLLNDVSDASSDASIKLKIALLVLKLGKTYVYANFAKLCWSNLR